MEGKNMRKIFKYILMAVALVATASCSNELDDTLQPVENGTLQFAVSDFPAFGEGAQTRAIGTQDEGKTEWVDGDVILVYLNSQEYGKQAIELKYNNGTWDSKGATLNYLANENPEIVAVYAPDCEIKDDKTIVLLEGKKYGTAEYIPANTTIEGNKLKISFESGRTYSRLRIVGLPNQTLTVTTTDFAPAGATEVATAAYTLTTDNNGNAFLYGVFAEGATVSVKQGDITLKDYTFSAEKNPNGTEYNKSYALQAGLIIDGTFGGKAEVTDENEITALVNTIKSSVDNGITTIIVTGGELAIYNGYYENYPAYAEALYYVTEENENSKYCGTIDLILQDVTKIGSNEFNTAYSLKSITLPKATTIENAAFHGCDYLQTLTFGSVLTSISTSEPFTWTGSKVEGGTDLVLNCGQMQTEGNYKPNLETNEWYVDWSDDAYKWNSITLTHTGACDECKAAEQ